MKVTRFSALKQKKNDYRKGDDLRKIALKPNEDRVRATVAPEEEALKTLSKALKDGSIQALMHPSVFIHLPFKFKTDQKAFKSGKAATFEMLPQNLTPAEDGRRWNVEGLVLSSDFKVKGKKADSPMRIKGYISTETGEAIVIAT